MEVARLYVTGRWKAKPKRGPIRTVVRLNQRNAVFLNVPYVMCLGTGAYRLCIPNGHVDSQLGLW